MKVLDTITRQHLNVDEAYEHFFDGFCDLGKPGEVFERTVVMSPPRQEAPPGVHRRDGPRRSGRLRRTGTHPAGRK